MNDPEKLRKLRESDYILKLEALVERMAEDAIVWEDNDERCRCVFCGAENIFEDRIVHAADCPVGVARRLGVVK